MNRLILLVDLFDSFHWTLKEDGLGLIDPRSIHGIYLRKYKLGFDELSFESIILLYQTLKERIDNIINNDNNDNNNNNNNGNDVVQQQQQWSWPLSTEQLQDILRQDCLDYEMDQNTTTSSNNDENITPSSASNQTMNDDNKTKPPRRIIRRRGRHSFEEMEMYIREMISKDPALPAAYFLRYLNCLRNNERVGALDALHQYFDHAMVHQHHHNGGISQTSSSSSTTTTDILQFSAILLAMTHSNFGDTNLALMATEEAVRVAQQSKDAACVAFALGWLFEHHGQGTADRRELLYRCAHRARAAMTVAAAAASAGNTPTPTPQQQQGQQQQQQQQQQSQRLRPLLAGAHLSLARHSLRGNNNENASRSNTVAGFVQPTSSASSSSWTSAWSNLLEVTAEPATGHRSLDRPTQLSQMPKETMESIALQRLVSAGIWDEIGMPNLSQWASKTALSRPEDLSYDDVITAIQNISRLALYGTPPSAAASKTTTKSKNDSRCVYAQSVHALLVLRKEMGMGENIMEESVLQNLALVLHEWSVNRGDLDDARALQTVLDSYLHPGLSNYDQLYMDIQFQKCLYYSRTKNWESARTTANELIEFCKRHGYLSNHVRTLIYVATMRLNSDRMQCTAAMPVLLEALAMCEKLEMHALHATGMSILAIIFLRLQNPQRAISILEAVLPTMIQREHVWFQAEAFLTLAKSHLRIVQKSSSKGAHSAGGDADQQLSSSDKRRYERALHALRQSLELFEACQDCVRLREVLFLQANIYSILGKVDKREQSSEQFIKIGSGGSGHEPEQKNKTTSTTILDALNDPIQLETLIDRSIY